LSEQSQTNQNHTKMEREISAQNPHRVTRRATRRWRSSMVEQLICNQQVAGSSPIASSAARDSHGGIPERSKGTDCKSVATGFEGSNPSPSTDRLRFHCLDNQIATSKENSKFAGVAQLVELQPSKLVVAGSRPVSRSDREPRRRIAHVAQLAEHVLGKDEVTRSIRVVGSKVKLESGTGRNDQPPREGQRDG
jgi:hypothetical protein